MISDLIYSLINHYTMSRLYAVIAVLLSLTVLMSHSDNPPNGKSGAPGDELCTECHSLDGGTQDGTLLLSGLPAVIEPNTTYMLTITNSNPNMMAQDNGLPGEAGFQMTILNSNNQKAGDFVAGSNDPNSVITNSGGRQYWEHDPSQTFPGTGSNSVSWTVSWKAPSAPANTTITYYAAGNVANGNDDNDGDLIITSVGSGMLNGGSALDVTITNSNDVLCNGQSTGSATATATGGAGPYTYHWSNGVNMATITNVASGTYSVTATDSDASTATTSVFIAQPPALAFQTPNITNVSCNGGANGSILAGATGGVSPYIFNWSNGASGPSISGLTAGSYTVTVTDDNACTKMATYQVTQPGLITINLVNLTHETCSGEDDGAITISVTGGVNPIFVEWSNGFIGNTITNLSPDTYSVTVTDNNDCTKTASYTVNPGGVVNVTLLQIQHVTCNGGNNGGISVSASGGQAPYTYAWSNGDSGASITNLTAGNYLVTATDNVGCQVVKLYTVNQPGPITTVINSTGQNLCAGDSLVNLTAVATGDAPPFNGTWSNGVTGLTNPGLPAGTYTVTITDNTGCTSTASKIVTAPSSLTVVVTTTDETAPGANDGTAIAVPSGGTPGYTYQWNNTATTDSIGGLTPGLYTVTVTDTNGCTATGSGQVDVFGCSLNIDLGPDLFICENDTIIIAAPAGLTSYIWNTGETTQFITVSAGGEYCVSGTDALGCQDADCIVITEDDFPLITCPVINESAPGLNDGAIQCDSIPGIVAYQWSNGATTASILGLSPGEYCVTLTNTVGCSDSQCFIIQPGNCNLVITSLVAAIQCNGDASGSVSVNVENATAPVTFLWSNGDTDATAENLVAGEYSVTINDGAGCGEIRTFILTEPTPLVITIDSVAPVQDFDSGLIHITPSGGVPPYDILWITPSQVQIPGEDLNNLIEPGYYQVFLMDANGCEVTVDSILVDEDVAVKPTPSFKNIKVYPVPTNDILNIEIENQITEAFISGIDGRVYKHIVNPASNKLQVRELESGWYIIRMTDGQSWYIARMVK